MPKEHQKYLGINAELAKSWPVITESKEPPADADQWDRIKNGEVEDKLPHLEK
ncbi:hypothetical protein NOC27_3276 [Nitrosococcus oceani AFC27]|nr:hypothetical protein NOC27_3276 [Nitrosococcus oceani AFC27]